MSEAQIVVYPKPADVSQAAAIRIGEALSRAVAERGVAHWVTTGGSTPGPIYRHLADSPLRETVPWEHVHLWWSDERWVRPDDILSNALACWDLLLRNAPIPLEQVHVIPIAPAMDSGEGPDAVAERYAATMRAAFMELDPFGFPRMDVILVGVGSDGHLFSVFPDSVTWDDPRWVQAVSAPTHIAPHVARVTLHGALVTAARRPIVVMYGAPKAAILGRLFGSPIDTRRLPAQLARRTGAVWLLDEAAASGIPPSVPVIHVAASPDAGPTGLPRIQEVQGVQAMVDPDRIVPARDGTPIAVFRSGVATAGTRPLVVVHGTGADHLTFRVVAPTLGIRRVIHAIDRRGRGRSGDAPMAYSIEREFEDLAAVAEALAVEAGEPVDVLGHSFGGRCALGASLLTRSIRRIVCYEGAPPRDAGPHSAYEPAWLLSTLAEDLSRGDLEGLLERFMRTVVGMDDTGMARFRADPVWPLRVAAAPTILREMGASNDPAAGLDALAHATVPILQVLGSESRPSFRLNTEALDSRLAAGRVSVIEGAAHAAHHTHPHAFVRVVETFLDEPDTGVGA
ncbi:MAG: 6-phosphogluconolactonase [Chloroflexi bacterium]|nr:6-phosphogluconolactonase [Chloroflexota bacterium]